MQDDVVIEKHIFKDVDFLFSDKLRSFHSDYVECFLLAGVGPPNTSLDEVNMTKNPEHPLSYYEKIVGGLLTSLPLLEVKSFSGGELQASCDVYYLNDGYDMDDLFLVQRITDWNQSNKVCHQVWRMHFESVFDIIKINKHWL
jgi:hypothetical protein